MLHSQKINLISNKIIKFKDITVNIHDVSSVFIDENFNAYTIFKNIPRAPECINVDNFLLYLSKNKQLPKQVLDLLINLIKSYYEDYDANFKHKN